jgi:para-nitrobenzyl esterase
MIVGFNHDEGAVFPAFGGGTPKGLDAAIAQYYRGVTPAAQAYFASADDREAERHGHEVFGDLIFNWNTTTLAGAAAQHGRAPVYFYNFLFRDVLDPHAIFTEGNAASLGAFHGAEIGYALRTVQAMRGRLDGPRQRMMTDMVSGYWLNLARVGSPNGAGLPTWPRYAPGTDSVLLIDAERTRPGPELFGDRLALLSKAWDARKA